MCGGARYLVASLFMLLSLVKLVLLKNKNRFLQKKYNYCIEA